MAIGGEKTFDQFVEEADLSVIEEAYRHAARAFSPDVTRTYAEHVGRARHEGDPEDALIEAHIIIAAMGMVPRVATYLDQEAEQLASQWLSEHRVAITRSGERRGGKGMFSTCGTRR